MRTIFKSEFCLAIQITVYIQYSNCVIIVPADVLELKVECHQLWRGSQHKIKYLKVSNIRRTKPQNLNASRLILQLSLPNPLKPGVQLRMKM